MEAGAACLITECRAIQVNALAGVDLGFPVDGKRSPNFETMIRAINASVGRPPGTHARVHAPRHGLRTVAACVFWTTRHQHAQCAGIMSSRLLTSSPIFAISPQPHGHSVLFGSIICSTLGK